MRLSSWLKDQGQTHEWLAIQLGVDRGTVTRYLSGARRPSWDIMPRIIEITRGDVTANDFIDLKPGNDGTESVPKSDTVAAA